MDNQEIIENFEPEEEVSIAKDSFLNNKTKRILIIIGAVSLSFILLLIIFKNALFYFNSLNQRVTPAPTPLPIAPKTSPIQSISKWATDSGVLKEEEKLKSLENSISNIDLNESGLSFPDIDFNTNFN